MATILALALTLGGFIFVLLLAVDVLYDPGAHLRVQRVFDLSPNKKRLSWDRRLRAALRELPSPAFLDPWVGEGELHWAGIALPLAEYRALWWLAILAGLGVGLLLLALRGWGVFNLALGLLLALVMGGAPYLVLQWRIRRRARAITRSLPDFLDLLTFTVQAGLGFTPALQRVSRGFPGPLGDEIRRVLEQIELGFARAEALDEFALRSPSPEVRNFVEAVKLTEQLGTSLARTLRIQVDMLRQTRRQRARAAAQTAPIRIIPALVFFFLPSLLLIYLAPPIINFFMRR